MLIVHYGKSMPWLRIAPQWANAEKVNVKMGRPPKKLEHAALLRDSNDGMGLRELAAKYGVSPSTARSHLNAARASTTAPVSTAMPTSSVPSAVDSFPVMRCFFLSGRQTWSWWSE